MAHDINGTEIAPGDLVMIPCRVVSVQETEDGKYCNVNVETVHPMPPYEKGQVIVLNTQQTVLFGRQTFAASKG